jgi:hypothetical protein
MGHFDGAQAALEKATGMAETRQHQVAMHGHAESGTEAALEVILGHARSRGDFVEAGRIRVVFEKQAASTQHASLARGLLNERRAFTRPSERQKKEPAKQGSPFEWTDV